MKKRILLFTAIAGICYLSFSSYLAGPATQGFDCTGAETGLSNPAGCSASGSSCHSTTATTGITVAIELDSAGIAKHYYIGGHTYTVKITGTNTTASTLPKFGFQLTAIKGSAAVVTPVNAGTWSATVPASTSYNAAIGGSYVCNLVEHSAPLNPTTGTGGTGSTIVESFTWTAPVAGTGTISFWGAVNAVNNDGLADVADKWNTTHIAIPEGPNAAGVAIVDKEMNISVYPNPVTNILNLQAAHPGTYTVIAYGLNGRNMLTEQMNGDRISINTSNWANGFYTIVVEKEGSTQVIPVVKQ